MKKFLLIIVTILVILIVALLAFAIIQGNKRFNETLLHLEYIFLEENA